MPRPLRTLVPGGIYHVTARGNRRQATFVDATDYAWFLDALAVVLARRRWRCSAYCLMPNHYHLVIQTPEPDLSAGMQLLNGSYAQRFNRRHELDGHLFQGRFHSLLVESNWHLLELARYIVLNPVRAGLVRDAGAWAWSSFRATAFGGRPSSLAETSWLLAQFGTTTERARAAYRRFVHEGIDAPRPL